MKKSIAILASGLLVIVGLVNLVHGSNKYHNAPYAQAAGGYPATSSSYNYGRDSAYGPYHSYAVRPALYGGYGLYTYKGYARHYPPPPISGNYKKYEYDASSKSSSAGSGGSGYGYGSGAPQQQKQYQAPLYGMKPVSVLLLVPDNSYKAMTAPPAPYGGGPQYVARRPSYGKSRAPSYGQSHGSSYGRRPSYGRSRPSSPYRSRRYRRYRSKCNQAMSSSPYAPRPSYVRRPRASYRPRPAYGPPMRPQYSSYKPQKSYGGGAPAAPASYGTAAPYRPQGANNRYQAPQQQQQRPYAPSQSSYGKY